MKQLPISKIIPMLKSELSKTNRIVLSAPPGAGKTTVIPISLLDEGWLDGKGIVVLQPRRLAARAAAERMSYLLNEGIGNTAGYRIRLESKVSKRTRIEVVTEGILTRMIQSDPGLSGTGLVIFDEFHERSIHSDLGLALCLDSQEALRDDLRILIMSATLDTAAISKILGNAPVISSTGRSFEVKSVYIPCPKPAPQFKESSMERHTASVIKKAIDQEEGDILVFLPGAPEIRRTRDFLEKSDLPEGVFLIPLYGMLSKEEQQLAIKPAATGKRKVVLSTSIAETSLTIEGIRIVIDAGFSRIPKFDPSSAMTRLETVYVSRASADQRRGRAGRTSPGICYRLWDKTRDESLKPSNDPEIINADLTSLALELAHWGVSDPGKLKWLNPPPAHSYTEAVNLLKNLGAVNEGLKITETGKKMLIHGIHPRLAHMIIKGVSLGLGEMACDIAALLGERDIIKQDSMGIGPDIRSRLDLLNSPHGKDLKNHADPFAVERIKKTSAYLKKQLGLAVSDNLNAEDNAGLLITFAYPDRIAMLRKDSETHYLMSCGKGAFLRSKEALRGEEFLAIAALDGEKVNARIFLAAPLTRGQLESHFASEIQVQTLCEWEEKSRSVSFRQVHSLGSLVLKEAHVENADIEIISKTLIQGIRKNGIDILPWDRESKSIISRISFINKFLPHSEQWPDVSEKGLSDSLEAWLMPYINKIRRISQISPAVLNQALLDLLTWRQKKILDELAPLYVRVPSGSKIRLDYNCSDVPVLAVKLQEMFGCSETPKVARGIPVIIHLLSPSGRPLQVTRDLSGFWAGAYQDVRKEMKGRYPKHNWPDNPLEARPTDRARPRRN